MIHWLESRQFLAISAPGCALLGLIIASHSEAKQQTTVYRYDALGRLVGAEVQDDSVPDKQPISTKIEYDAAGNRSKYVTVNVPPTEDLGGGSSPSKKPCTVVVPLNGYTLIHIPNCAA